jgi:hypothetical protein
MRKTIVATLALFISLMVLSPAQAVQVQPRQHHGTVCKEIFGNLYPFPQLAEVCITTNTKDIQWGDVQALAWVTWETNSNIEVKWDWIHLYRNGDIEEQNGSTSWADARLHTGEWNDYQTPWDLGGANGDVYRSVHRVRFRSNFQISDWYKFDSSNWTCGSYCNNS